MTADIVNLRRARKNKVRTAKEAQAAENRLRFGQSKADRQAMVGQSRIDRARLDGARRSTDADDTKP